MRKLLTSGLLILALGTGTALAQQGFFAGGSLGLTFPSILGVGISLFGFQGSFGVENIFLDNLSIRGDVGLGFGGVTGVSVTSISLGVNGVFNFEVSPDLPIRAYAGGGPRVDILSLSTPAANPVSATGFGLGFIGGAEYRFDQIGVFAEVGVDLAFVGIPAIPSVSPATTVNVVAPAIRAGANFHF